MLALNVISKGNLKPCKTHFEFLAVCRPTVGNRNATVLILYVEFVSNMSEIMDTFQQNIGITGVSIILCLSSIMGLLYFLVCLDVVSFFDPKISVEACFLNLMFFYICNFLSF